MSRLIKYTDDLLAWKRPAGPIKVWRVVDGRKKRADGKTLRFSIQEIPEDRFDDVLDFMCAEFMRYEPMCEYLKASEDPAAVEDIIKLWSWDLQKGLVTAAFLMDDENESKPVLAGVNMKLVVCDATKETIRKAIQIRSETALKMLRTLSIIEEEINVRKFFNVDKVISAHGLCIHSDFRGQGLGFQLLDARNEIAAAYNIPATAHVFTSKFAAHNAAQAGFEVILERDFADIKNEDGTEKFPGIKHKSIKLMGKKY